MIVTSEGPIEVNVTIAGHSRIDFDKKAVRRTLRKEGRSVQRVARRLVARKAISEPGQYPGKRTGALQRAIDLVVGKSGFWVRVEPTTKRIKEVSEVYYPAILFYGSRKRGIEKRDNYMTAALEARKSAASEALRATLAESLIPR